MLAVSRSYTGVFGVKLMRAGNVQGIDIAVGCQVLDGLVCRRIEIPFELPAGLFTRITGAYQLDAAIGQEGRQHEGECPAQTDHPQT
ncbi:hypothetical protein D3C73_964850 [compost metagenome]